jgi:hypothetical protein
MKGRRKKWGFVVVGAVAALTLGVIAVASAATQSPSPSPSASSQVGQAQSPAFDGDGPHGDGARIHGGGPGDMAQALAKLSGKDESTIMSQRAAGKSYAEIAKAYSVSTDELLAEATSIETSELDAAVKAGSMTAAERTQELSGLQERLQAALTETGAPPAHGGHGPGHDGDGPQASSGSSRSSGATGAAPSAGASSGATQAY